MKRESPLQKQRRTSQIIAGLRKKYPSPTTALAFVNPLELLVATILSAQCTDVRVNLVTPELFRKYSSVKAFANAVQEELEQDIRSTGFFRNKAKSIIGCCSMVLERHGGVVPQTMEELILLPGVGRKTANCVLGACFGINAGVVVDTHVGRLSERLGLSNKKTAEKIEQDLMTLVPQKDWYRFSNLLILHGRKVCIARKPNCPDCSIRKNCPSADKFVRQFWK